MEPTNAVVGSAGERRREEYRRREEAMEGET
jgi:hypothetical protein